MADRSQILATLEFVRELGVKFKDEDNDLLDLYANGDGVAIIGLLKRGKSTLVNSILGVQVSPIGREPETWCAINVTNGRWKAWARQADGVEVPLPADPEAFRESITRRGGSVSRDVNVAQIRCPNRLPEGLRLIDTPGLLEVDLEEADLVWRRSGAIAAVLISSFPPGVGKEERELLEKMMKHFGDHVRIVMKGLDSELTAEDLESAGEVWARYGRQPIRILESRIKTETPWGSGPFAELETAISELNAQAKISVERIAIRAEEILVRASREFFKSEGGIRSSLKSQDTDIDRARRRSLVQLRRSFDLPLLMEVKILAARAFVSEFESKELSREPFAVLVDAAHCGSSAAQRLVKSIWSSRISASSLKTSSAVSGSGVTDKSGFLEMLDVSLPRPTYSHFSSTDCIEVTHMDLFALERDRGLTVRSLAPLKSSIERFIGRLVTARDCDGALQLTLPDEYRAMIAARLLKMIRTGFETRSDANLEKIFSEVSPHAWADVGPSTRAALDRETTVTLGKLYETFVELRSTNPVVTVGPYRAVATSFLSGQVPGDAARAQKTARFLWTLRRYLSDECVREIESLIASMEGPKGLVAWIEHVRTSNLEREAVRRIHVRRGLLLGALFGISCVLLLSFRLWLAGVAALGGSLLFGAVAYRRENEDLPVPVYSFDEFALIDDLDGKAKRRRRSDERLAVVTTLGILFGLIAAIFSEGARDINQLSEVAVADRAIDTVVSPSDTGDADGVFESVGPEPSEAVTESTTETMDGGLTTEASSPETQVTVAQVATIDISQFVNPECGQTSLSVDPGAGSLEVVSETGAASVTDKWSLSAADVVKIACGSSSTLLTLTRLPQAISITDWDIFDSVHLERLSPRILRFGTHGDQCCYPDVPYDRAEVVKLSKTGRISREASDIDRFPLWNASIDYCDRLASEGEFNPMRPNGEAMYGVDGYATVCVEGPLVERLQEILVEEGYDIAIDGEFGPRTLRALKSLAAAEGVANVDGVAAVDGDLFFARTAGRR